MDMMIPLESKMNKTHDTVNKSHRQTQKQIFIKKLKSKVLDNLCLVENCEVGR